MFTILYQDKDLLVIDKPSGIVVNRAQSVKGATIQDWMESKFDIRSLKFKTKDSEFINRSGVVHRLDKDTSGALVIAKTPEAFQHLKNQFKARTVKKQYQALTHGIVVPSEGEVKAPVGRLPWNRMRFGVFPGGRDAHSCYRVDNVYTNKDGQSYSLVSVFPTTGRTHQIRVHLQYIKHPIVSDPLYAGRKRVVSDRKWCLRLFLHAVKLSFDQPNTLKRITVGSALPEELEKALSILQPKLKT